MNNKITVGIVGIGRLGTALANKFSSETDLLLADKVNKKAVNLANAISAKAVKLSDIFNKSEVLIIAVPPDQIIPLIRKYAKLLRPNTIVVNMATSVSTSEVEQVINRKDVKIVGLKMVGQAHALSLGMKAVFVSSAKDKKSISVLRKLFSTFGMIITGDEMKAGEINAIATRFGLSLAIGLRDRLKKICNSEDIINAAIKTVAVGTILDYPLQEPNEYINQRLKELKKWK